MNNSISVNLYNYLLYFSGLFSQIRFMKISCINRENIYKIISEIHMKEKPPKKTYWIDTDLNKYEIERNFKKIIKDEMDLVSKNVQYFSSYLKCFYDFIISNEEMERILENINNIRQFVKNKIKRYSLKNKRFISNLIKTNLYFYNKKTKDVDVCLYKTIYLELTVVVKVYKYFMNDSFSKYFIENKFENEIFLQKYAETLNKPCNFISPKIYSFGSILNKENSSTNIYYLYIIMEYIPGITLQHIDFTPDVCKKIYDIDKNLKCHLLNHNDLKSRNIIIRENDDLVLLDYGESSHCI